MTPDEWMASNVLMWAGRYGAAGASRQNLADGDYWFAGPESVQALTQREKGLLLDRTLRRLVRHGRLRIEHHRELRARAADEIKRRFYCTVNRYVRVNILMALALAANEP